MQQKWKLILSGLLAGLVNGLFGAGGGMLLVPLLSLIGMNEEEIFPTSVSIIYPICFVSLFFTAAAAPLPLTAALPYLIGGACGGILVVMTGRRVPVVWLHRLLGLFILWGGIRYLW